MSWKEGKNESRGRGEVSEKKKRGKETKETDDSISERWIKDRVMLDPSKDESGHGSRGEFGGLER